MITPTEIPTGISEDTEKGEILDRILEPFETGAFTAAHSFEDGETQDTASIIEIPYKKTVTNNPSEKNLVNIKRQAVMVIVSDGVSMQNGHKSAKIIDELTNTVIPTIDEVDKDPTVRGSREKRKDFRSPKNWLNHINTKLLKAGQQEFTRASKAGEENPKGIMAAGAVAKIERRNGKSDISIAVSGDITPLLYLPGDITFNLCDKKARTEGSDHLLDRALGNEKKLIFDGDKANADFREHKDIPEGSMLIIMSDGITDVLAKVIKNNPEELGNITTVAELVDMQIRSMENAAVSQISRSILDFVIHKTKEFPDKYKDDDRSIAIVKM